MKKSPLFLLGAAVVALALTGCGSAMPAMAKNVKVTISFVASKAGAGGADHLSGGVWVQVAPNVANPLFTKGQRATPALEELAELGKTEMLAKAVSNLKSGTFPGSGMPFGAKGMTSFTLMAEPGYKLYFATMVAPSNDWFAAPDMGIVLVDSTGHLAEGEISVPIWDAGTENDVANPKPPNDDGKDPNPAIRTLTSEKAMIKVMVKVEEVK